MLFFVLSILLFELNLSNCLEERKLSEEDQRTDKWPFPISLCGKCWEKKIISGVFENIYVCIIFRAIILKKKIIQIDKNILKMYEILCRGWKYNANIAQLELFQNRIPFTGPGYQGLLAKIYVVPTVHLIFCFKLDMKCKRIII